MTTIASRVKKILAIVDEIKSAIEEKGVSVPDSAIFPEIPDYISQIVSIEGLNFTEIITDTFSGTVTEEIPDVTHISDGFSGTITDSQILFNTSGFTIVGAPSISDDGLVSGFSTSNYISIPKSDIFTTAFPDFVMQCRFKTGSSSSAQAIIHGEKGVNLEMTSAKALTCYNWGKATTNTIYTPEDNTWYIIEIIGNSEESTKTYNLYSDNKAELLATVVLTDTSTDFTNTSYNFYLGLSSYNSGIPFAGTIDINNTYINNTTDGIYWKPSVSIEDLTL